MTGVQTCALPIFDVASALAALSVTVTVVSGVFVTAKVQSRPSIKLIGTMFSLLLCRAFCLVLFAAVAIGLHEFNFLTWSGAQILLAAFLVFLIVPPSSYAEPLIAVSDTGAALDVRGMNALWSALFMVMIVLLAGRLVFDASVGQRGIGF